MIVKVFKPEETPKTLLSADYAGFIVHGKQHNLNLDTLYISKRNEYIDVQLLYGLEILYKRILDSWEKAVDKNKHTYNTKYEYCFISPKVPLKKDPRFILQVGGMGINTLYCNYVFSVGVNRVNEAENLEAYYTIPDNLFDLNCLLNKVRNLSDSIFISGFDKLKEKNLNAQTNYKSIIKVL